MNHSIACRIECELTDGKKIYYVEKTFRLPCWLQEGMELDLVLWAFPKVASVTTNPLDCTQSALLEGAIQCEPHKLADLLNEWLADGWIVCGEDTYITTNDVG